MPRQMLKLFSSIITAELGGQCWPNECCVLSVPWHYAWSLLCKCFQLDRCHLIWLLLVPCDCVAPKAVSVAD